MKKPTLVTGATGRVGRALVPRLLSVGHDVRLLSRRPSIGQDTRCEWVTGDLLSGDGLDTAVAGAGTIVHCATSTSRADVDGMRKLLRAAQRAGSPHVVYVSIVGVDRVPLSYYRAKLACEQLLERSGLPWTVQRATQFHDLIIWMCTGRRWLPAIVMPAGVSFQPIDVRDLADRLTLLAGGAPAGRAPDLGGPEIRTAADLAQTYRRTAGFRRPVVRIPMPGRVMRGYREGRHLVPEHAAGTITFAEFLTEAHTKGRGA